MVKSHNNRHIWYVYPGSLYDGKTMIGGWYYTDETEDFGGGPYSTEKDAIEELNKYAAWLTGGENVPI